MNNSSLSIKKIFVRALFSLFIASLPFHTIYATPPGGAIEPSVSKGITLLPLKQHPVPDFLKTQARLKMRQMKRQGFIDATEASVSYLDKVKENNEKQFETMDVVSSKLKIIPADLNSSLLGQSVLLGASSLGGKTEEGWTGLTRIFNNPKLGIIGLEERDFVASGGGMTFIEEAINQDINGFPAVLSVKKSQSGKGLSELTWATDQKIFTLRINRALQTQKSIDQFLNIARKIF